VRWPEEGIRLQDLRAARAPRLLLLDAESEPPQSADCLEDWIRLPADYRDVGARAAALAARADAQTQPEVDGDGLLHHRGRWVALSAVETALAVTLINRFGAVVGRDTLVRRAWPNGAPSSSNALDVTILRLRRRIVPLGLEVRTVRSRGFLMQGEQPRAGSG
jgi:two-component system, OmpR family, response regulator